MDSRPVDSAGLERTTSDVSVDKTNTSTSGAIDVKEELAPSLSSLHSGVVIVDFTTAQGVPDPHDPRTLSKFQKWVITVLVGLMTFLSPITSTLPATAQPEIAADFGITSETVQAMVVSIFILAYAFGPLIWSPISEHYGRHITYQVSGLLYLVFNLACAFAQSTGQLLAFRFLAGAGGSAPLSLGAGVLSDIWAADERGKAIALYSVAPLVGPALGPVCGAWVAEKSQWRWVFWASSAFAGVLLLAYSFFSRETYAPTVLKRLARSRKAAYLKQTSPSIEPQLQFITIYEQGQTKTQLQTFKAGIQRPFDMLFRESILIVLGLYMSLLYGLMYLETVTVIDTWIQSYGQSRGIAGLHYLAFGLGLTFQSQLQGIFSDRTYAKLTLINGGHAEPEFRIPWLIPASIAMPAGLLIYGWSSSARVFWLVPDIGFFLMGCGISGNFMNIYAYIIDAYGRYSASALSAIIFSRSLAAFALPLGGAKMKDTLGIGGASTLLAGLSIVLGWPGIAILWYYGKTIRRKSRYGATEQ